ncbi:MAG: hypothetical protein IKA65_01310 [Lentisphaeria bacterium]|nr:hypothetical protein [Lentisphaeria bacterium]
MCSSQRGEIPQTADFPQHRKLLKSVTAGDFSPAALPRNQRYKFNTTGNKKAPDDQVRSFLFFIAYGSMV